MIRNKEYAREFRMNVLLHLKIVSYNHSKWIDIMRALCNLEVVRARVRHEYVDVQELW